MKKHRITGRKIAAKGTQEGFLSFYISPPQRPCREDGAEGRRAERLSGEIALETARKCAIIRIRS